MTFGGEASASLIIGLFNSADLHFTNQAFAFPRLSAEAPEASGWRNVPVGVFPGCAARSGARS